LGAEVQLLAIRLKFEDVNICHFVGRRTALVATVPDDKQALAGSFGDQLRQKRPTERNSLVLTRFCRQRRDERQQIGFADASL